MFPVKPSQTTTSAALRSRSRPSTFPMKSRPGSAASSAWASRTRRLPFSGSSPIESSATVGRAAPAISLAKTAPMWANWTRCSGRASAFAPASIRIETPPIAGRGTAIPGRWTSGSRRSSTSAAASMAPVFPAETTTVGVALRDGAAGEEHRALALLAHGLRRLVVHGHDLLGMDDLEPFRERLEHLARAVEHRCDVRGLGASAPATISSGARSPPMASTATRTGGID